MEGEEDADSRRELLQSLRGQRESAAPVALLSRSLALFSTPFPLLTRFSSDVTHTRIGIGDGGGRPHKHIDCGVQFRERTYIYMYMYICIHTQVCMHARTRACVPRCRKPRVQSAKEASVFRISPSVTTVTFSSCFSPSYSSAPFAFAACVLLAD